MDNKPDNDRTPQTRTNARGKKAECCTDLQSESGCRNHYFDGKRLTTDSFRVEQRYHLGRRHLLNRAIHGWGVVYGFGISRKAGRLEITPGLALDECGRELVQTGSRLISLEDLIPIDANGRKTARERVFSAGSHEKERACWLLSVHYAEQPAGRITVEDSCHCRHDEWERVCETVRYSLQRVDCKECCRKFECELECDCPNEPCCDARKHDREPDYEREPEHRRVSEYRREPDYEREPEHRSPANRQPPTVNHQPPTANHPRGGCRCLCDHLTGRDLTPENCEPCEIDDPCGPVRVDLRNGVPLACIEIVQDESECSTLGKEIEICGPRRLVKRNDLLFDLIRGCDLTRIAEIGWKKWHRSGKPVPFDEFSAAFGAESSKEHEYVTNLFWVRFTRPVRRDTLRPDCFVMRAMSGEREGGWLMALRAPIVRIETGAGDYVSMATIVVDGAWLEDGVRGRRSLFLGGETWIEIEIRGDFIIDCNGQAVDANAAGLSPGPTGNASPGGTFLSTFRVEAAAPYAYASADRDKGASS